MIKKIIIGFIRLYQIFISPLLNRCRFQPSCSQYAIYAIEIHGTVRGLQLALQRIWRCRPTFRAYIKTIGHNWGYDPVIPIKKTNT